MARRRPADVSASDVLVLPRHLAHREGLRGEEYRALWQERHEWLKAHGVNPGDWHEVSRIYDATRTHYGLPDRTALTRARLKVKDTDA